MLKKGRGAQFNTTDPFARLIRESVHPEPFEEDAELDKRQKYIEVYPKTIVNKVASPDTSMEWSLNAYQGCEHGCIYCYARNTHPYWGYSAGLDFERIILVKKTAPDLLRKHLASKTWKAAPIVMSGNTDCYQPVEGCLQITRRLLEVFHTFRHPVGIITKNQLVRRDLDLLQALAQDQLVRVAISVTTLDESLRQCLEPRTATVAKRLQTISALAQAGIPVSVMAAPMIPGLNDHELVDIVRVAAQLGATGAGYTIVRLNGDVAALFDDWLMQALPDRRDKIMKRIADCHAGQVGDSQFGRRMKGIGKYAEILRDQFQLATRRYLPPPDAHVWNTALYAQQRDGQLTLEF